MYVDVGNSDMGEEVHGTVVRAEVQGEVHGKVVHWEVQGEVVRSEVQGEVYLGQANHFEACLFSTLLDTLRAPYFADYHRHWTGFVCVVWPDLTGAGSVGAPQSGLMGVPVSDLTGVPHSGLMGAPEHGLAGALENDIL